MSQEKLLAFGARSSLGFATKNKRKSFSFKRFLLNLRITWWNVYLSPIVDGRKYPFWYHADSSHENIVKKRIWDEVKPNYFL